MGFLLCQQLKTKRLLGCFGVMWVLFVITEIPDAVLLRLSSLSLSIQRSSRLHKSSTSHFQALGAAIQIPSAIPRPSHCGENNTTPIRRVLLRRGPPNSRCQAIFFSQTSMASGGTSGVLDLPHVSTDPGRETENRHHPNAPISPTDNSCLCVSSQTLSFKMSEHALPVDAIGNARGERNCCCGRQMQPWC